MIAVEVLERQLTVGMSAFIVMAAVSSSDALITLLVIEGIAHSTNFRQNWASYLWELCWEEAWAGKRRVRGTEKSRKEDSWGHHWRIGERVM